jgi:hypothetical protein
MADGHFSVATFLLAGCVVGLACAATYAAAALVCRFGHDGMKRARAAAEAFPASGPPLGFGVCGGAPTAAAAMSAVGGIM